MPIRSAAASPVARDGLGEPMLSRMRDCDGMPRPVPAATAALRVLRYLSARTTPGPGRRIAARRRPAALDHLPPAAPPWPRSRSSCTTPRTSTWGVGVAAWEVGQGFTRQEPLDPAGPGADRPTGRRARPARPTSPSCTARTCVYLDRGARAPAGPAGHRCRGPAAGAPDRVGTGDPGRPVPRPGPGALPRRRPRWCSGPDADRPGSPSCGRCSPRPAAAATPRRTRR